MNKNFVAVDTSGSYLTVVVGKQGEFFSVSIPNCMMKHSVSVMPAVDEALQKANMTLEECDFFSAVVGAGSFTGIRIGISVVKGFCLAYNKPSLPITSFDVAAYNGLGEGKTLCLVDALHDCYYACGYERGEVILPPAYLTEEQVLSLVEEGYSLCGVGKFPIAEKVEVVSCDPVEGLKNAVCAKAEKGAFEELVALYVRKSSAELNLEEKK
ncbi:MAG: tRNA (adenosine(37)-N6)-threonylcarbamoyltransferase complex dimerization subunit type 1 TsaB [Clostridia bacterium]|nr:tRNA (adenosine(37)-N6)-threonylcarbamoyltransferase complex dimerization subunit type 1 TsaB [Clostridia bacterium]